MLRFAEQTLAVYVQASIERGIHEDSIDVLIETLKGDGRSVVIVKVQEC